MIKGLDKVLKNLNNVRRELKNNIDTLFIKNSLEWIRDRAIQLLKNNLSFAPNYFGTEVTDVKEWSIIPTTNKSYILECNYENSASIEFGIGVVGESNPHPIAESVGFEYDVPSDSKRADGAWNFIDQNEEIWYNFSGYQGKSFLYNALMEYKQNNVWVKIYQATFDEIMRGVIK